ncbi:nuclear transport factor 2 family protein [Winogradskyella immobilis]|uniref:Nuclear transport factor 2 family protein n=1 Tax=Winogradskyella immobilis TaxID=2816852 RepID=A0ABS8EMX0_9FLAO|nr:nuclear transport factor 2 family protein [Winogradskyella immobilis]MCC1483657.1 nuclear transport factor 2 family protein [Winogradskyella immobilis]MCG0015751.1 nuclear transport factor 2 family protein [Winogradskyella immobilis]
MKALYLFLMLIFGATINAQSNAKSIQNEIDKTVWKPFQNAFETLDASALNAIYADKTLRVTPQGIDTEEAYKLGNIERFKASKTNKVSIKLDFWFDSRFTNKTTSYEVGFYRIRATVNGSVNDSYGQFHIVLKKINGQWKITQDWDTTTINGHALNKDDFETHAPLKF